ncbi:zinc-finger domain-containing protein [Candidatus Bandiella euplotis]|uniref:Zinc-finger domain protein n=1 Tax=Candidatus Bandiella euplotis TaxID=1664265 RepID=A0ABZ0UJ73_9RICK|nr:zinc-finger domain-containing protein [Candidatus Bandiella woodruffii]WPX95982.1 Putative zinc-finger domain protein [Candidatus Bandiella woodruffii]
MILTNKMLQTNDIVYSTKTEVQCHGESKEFGHPRVYLKISSDNKIACPYCSRQFIYTPLDQTAHNRLHTTTAGMLEKEEHEQFKRFGNDLTTQSPTAMDLCRNSDELQ